MDRQPANESSHPGGAVRWGVAVVALFAGIGWFLSQNLQNNAQFSRLDLAFLLPEMLGELVSPSVAPGDQASPSGWQYFPERLPLLGYVAVLLAMSWCWGNLYVRRLLPSDEMSDQVERVYWSMVTGLAIWGTLTLLLGLIGALHPLVFCLVGYAPLMFAIITRRRQPQTAERQALPAKARWSGLAVTCSIAVIPFLLAMLLGALLPSTDFDVRE